MRDVSSRGAQALTVSLAVVAAALALEIAQQIVHVLSQSHKRAPVARSSARRSRSH